MLLPGRDEVSGRVYFTSTRPPRAGAVSVLSEVTAQHADRDEPLHDAVGHWLDNPWPWTTVDYAPRP